LLVFAQKCIENREETGDDVDDNELDAEDDSLSNVSAVEEDSTKSDAVEENMETKSEADVVKEQRGNRKRSRDNSNTSVANQIGKLVGTSTKVMQQIADRRDSMKTKPQEFEEDKDWIFAKLIYTKMKEIPEGLEKDDLQIDIQKLISDARKRTSAPRVKYSAWPTSTIPSNQWSIPPGQLQQQLAYGSGGGDLSSSFSMTWPTVNIPSNTPSHLSQLSITQYQDRQQPMSQYLSSGQLQQQPPYCITGGGGGDVSSSLSSAYAVL